MSPYDAGPSKADPLFPADFQQFDSPGLRLAPIRTTGAKKLGMPVTHSQVPQPPIVTKRHASRPDPAPKKHSATFVQTLTKTFCPAVRSVAIFDTQKILVLFNPALIDLTGLGAQFLSARPEIQTFFDKLRENVKIPNPKN